MDLNATEHILFGGWAAVWLIGPLIGWLVAKRWPAFSRGARRVVLVLCALTLALAGCTLFAPWTLRGFWANAVNLAVAFVACTVLVWLTFRKCRKWLAVLAPLVVHAVAAIGIFAGLVLSNNQIPFRQIPLGHGLVARIYRIGFMGSRYDQAVLVSQPAALPLLEHRFFSRRVDYWDCTETSAKLVPTAAGDTVQIVCGAKVLETVPAP